MQDGLFRMIFTNANWSFISIFSFSMPFTLPAYVENMMQNYNNTRHCCPGGQYWKPEDGLCTDFSECYGDATTNCQFDFRTELDAWIGNYYNIIGIVEDEYETSMDNIISNCHGIYMGNSEGDTDFDLQYCSEINDTINSLTNCFDLTAVVTGINPECCCPIWQYGENTYAYTDVEYYQSS